MSQMENGYIKEEKNERKKEKTNDQCQLIVVHPWPLQSSNRRKFKLPYFTG